MNALTEKDVERMGDRLMSLYGFTVIRFSQARASRQTEGIPDRLYLHPSRRLAVWWEAKRPGGRVSKHQRAFHAMASACGMVVLCGTHEVLKSWLTERITAKA